MRLETSKPSERDYQERGSRAEGSLSLLLLCSGDCSAQSNHSYARFLSLVLVNSLAQTVRPWQYLILSQAVAGLNI